MCAMWFVVPHLRLARYYKQAEKGRLLVQAARVYNGLRVTVATKDDQQVGNHGGAALVVEFDNVVFG